MGGHLHLPSQDEVVSAAAWYRRDSEWSCQDLVTFEVQAAVAWVIVAWMGAVRFLC